MRPVERLICSLSALLLLVSGSCAHTWMTSQLNPETANREFRTLLVHGNFQSLEFRQLSETQLSSEISSRFNVKCIRACDVFFPGQSYTADQILERLRGLGVDAVIVIQATGTGTTSAYIPQTSYTTGQASVYGNTLSGSSTTRTYGGYTVTKPFAGFEVSLWAVSDGTVAWYATATSSGNAFADWSDLIRSACSETVARMATDGLWR